MSTDKKRQGKVRIALLLTFSCLFSFYTRAQTNFEPTYYMNLFHGSAKNAAKGDSSVFSIRILLANGYRSEVSYLIHEDLAQNFIQYNYSDADLLKNERRAGAKAVLKVLIMDTDKVFTASLQPLYCLSKAQEAYNNEDSLKIVTADFIDHYLFTKDQFADRSLRYGLMIYEVLAKHPHLASISERLLDQLEVRVRQEKIDAGENSSDQELKDRAWFRYYLAYINYLRSDRATTLPAKGKYLKLASDYSPDQLDHGHTPIMAGYDPFFFHSYRSSFKADYYNFLIHNNKERSEILQTIADLSIVDPDYKDSLRSYYNASFSGRESFDQYWRGLINSKAKNVPPLEITLLDSSRFSSKALAGKWIYLDFWATWCGPCRAEHPGLQQFYDSVVRKHADKIAILAIGCQDDPEKVRKYIQEKQYTFPVAYAFNNIKDIYAKAGFPGKALITPEGKCIPVIGANWEDIIRKYSGIGN